MTTLASLFCERTAWVLPRLRDAVSISIWSCKVIQDQSHIAEAMRGSTEIAAGHLDCMARLLHVLCACGDHCLGCCDSCQCSFTMPDYSISLCSTIIVVTSILRLRGRYKHFDRQPPLPVAFTLRSLHDYLPH